MSAPRKRWDEHSERWKREKTKQGLNKQRWDSWFKLSAKSRAVSDPYKYAAGQSVLQQRRAPLESAALSRLRSIHVNGRDSTMKLGVAAMNAAQLRWTAKATTSQLVARAGMKVPPGERNPWWYR